MIIDGRSFTIGAPVQSPSSSPILLDLQIARLIGSLLKVLRRPLLDAQTIQAFDDEIQHVDEQQEVSHSTDDDQPFTTRRLGRAWRLQDLRLRLFRHNLTPLADAEMRIEALEKCRVVSKNTATLLHGFMISRVDKPDSKSDDEARGSVDHDKMVEGSTQLNRPWQTLLNDDMPFIALLCTHLWRCALFLACDLHSTAEMDQTNVAALLTILKVMAGISEKYPITTICRSHLLFAFKKIDDKRSVALSPLSATAEGEPEDLDEDLIALVSGDLQGSPTHCWVWAALDGGDEDSDNDEAAGAADDDKKMGRSHKAPKSEDPTVAACGSRDRSPADDPPALGPGGPPAEIPAGATEQPSIDWAELQALVRRWTTTKAPLQTTTTSTPSAKHPHAPRARIETTPEPSRSSSSCPSDPSTPATPKSLRLVTGHGHTYEQEQQLHKHSPPLRGVFTLGASPAPAPQQQEAQAEGLHRSSGWTHRHKHGPSVSPKAMRQEERVRERGEGRSATGSESPPQIGGAQQRDEGLRGGQRPGRKSGDGPSAGKGGSGSSKMRIANLM